jgi:hypothetical protein
VKHLLTGAWSCQLHRKSWLELHLLLSPGPSLSHILCTRKFWSSNQGGELALRSC